MWRDQSEGVEEPFLTIIVWEIKLQMESVAVINQS